MGKGLWARAPLKEAANNYYEEEAQRERAKSDSTNIKEGKFSENRNEEFVGHSEQDSFRPDKHQKKCPRRKGRNGDFEMAIRKAKTMKMELSSENVQEMKGTFVVKNCNGGNKYAVTIRDTASCTCAYQETRFGQAYQVCKHIICVYLNFLHTDEESNLIQQVALTTRELRGLFQNYQKEGKRNQQTQQGPSPPTTPPPLRQQQAGDLQQPFQVAFFGKAVKCYGCQRPFGTQMKKVPKNLILKNLGICQYTDKNSTKTQSTLLQNTFYHLNLECIGQKYPMTELSHIIIHEEIRDKIRKRNMRNMQTNLDSAVKKSAFT